MSEEHRPPMANEQPPIADTPRRFRGVTAPPEPSPDPLADASNPAVPTPPSPSTRRRSLLLLLLVALLGGGLLLGLGLLRPGERSCESGFVTAARDKLQSGGWRGTFSYTRSSAGGTVLGEPIDFAVETTTRWSRTLRSAERGDSELISIDGQIWTRDGAGVWGLRPGSGWVAPWTEIWAALPGDAIWTATDRPLGGGRCVFEARSALERSFLGTIEIPDGGYWPSRLLLTVERIGPDGVLADEIRELLVTPTAVTVEAPQ